MKIAGAYTALITPFMPDQELDIPAFKELLQMQCEAGIDGIVILGTTGEAATIDDDERELLIQVAANTVQGRTPLLVGCGTYSTKKTVFYARQAQMLGADAVLVVTPYYNRPSQEGLFQHYRAVAESITIPCCIYNIPTRTGQNIAPATVARLMHISNIIAIKEDNIQQVPDSIEQIMKQDRAFTLMASSDSATLSVMALGGHGIISVISNLVPHRVKQLVTAIENGNLKEAQQCYYSLKPLVEMAFIETNPVPIKRMMEHAGLCHATVRLPLVPLQTTNDLLLQQLFKDEIWNEIRTLAR